MYTISVRWKQIAARTSYKLSLLAAKVMHYTQLGRVSYNVLMMTTNMRSIA
jgi:hypothetical protein